MQRNESVLVTRTAGSMLSIALLAAVILSTQVQPLMAQGKDTKGAKDDPAAAAAAAAAAPTVAVEPVASRVPVTLKKYTGMFEAINKVMSVSRVSGNIMNAPFNEGDLIKKGDLLFDIEDTAYVAAVDAAKAKIATSEAAIKQAEADILRTSAQLRYAQTSYDRDKELFDTGTAVSKDVLESKESALDGAKAQKAAADAALLSARAALKSAEAALVLAEFDLSHTKIYSEITGRAGRLVYSAGNFVTPSSGALITVTQLDPIYVQFTMSEKDFTSLFGNVANLKQFAKIEIMLADGTMYDKPGEIKFIDNSIKTATDTLRIWAEFPNPDELLNPGGIARVYLRKSGGAPMPSVKNSAIVQTAQGPCVYVVDANNTVSFRPVQLGSSDTQFTTILSGVKEGEVVIVKGTHKVMMPGMPVKPVPDTAPEVPANAAPAAPSLATPAAAEAAPAAPKAAPAGNSGK